MCDELNRTRPDCLVETQLVAMRVISHCCQRQKHCFASSGCLIIPALYQTKIGLDLTLTCISSSVIEKCSEHLLFAGNAEEKVGTW